MAGDQAFIRADEATTRGHCFILFSTSLWLCSNTLSGPFLHNDRPAKQGQFTDNSLPDPQRYVLYSFFSTHSIDDVI